MQKSTTERKPWWGDYPLEVGQWLDISVGPARYVLQRLEPEWRIWSVAGRNPLATTLTVKKPSKRKPNLDGLSMLRLGFQQSPESLNILPTMTDRPVVVLPDQPVVVPSGERITFYVTTALRIQFRAPNGGQLLHELPTYLPSDSWFGNTMQGELCYAGRTWARTSIAELPDAPHRAITCVEVINRAATPLKVEKLRLPTTNLALYLGEDGRFHTQAVRMLREEDDEAAKITLVKDAEGQNRELISAAREPLDGSRRIPAFGWLFR